MTEWISLGDLLPDLSVEVDVTTSPRTATRTWTAISDKVRTLQYTRSGRNDELQRTSTGTMVALCDDRDGAISGLGIKKRQWIRVRARWDSVIYPVWQGIFESLPRKWPEYGSDATIELHAADVLKILRLYPLDGRDATTDPTVFGAVRNDQRVSGILTLASLTAGTIDTGTDDADAVADPFATGSDALTACTDIEASENGLLVAEPDGTVSFQGRHYRLLNSATSLATFGENAGEIPYDDDVEYDDDDVWIANIAAVTPLGGSAITVEDADSQNKYWPTRIERSLLTSSTAIASDAAHYLVNKYGDPAPRIPQIGVRLAAVARKTPAEMGTLLGAGNSDRFTWSRAASTAISKDVYLEQMAGSISRDGFWDLRLQLSPAMDDQGWVLGQTGASELGQTTVLTY